MNEAIIVEIRKMQESSQKVAEYFRSEENIMFGIQNDVTIAMKNKINIENDCKLMEQQLADIKKKFKAEEDACGERIRMKEAVLKEKETLIARKEAQAQKMIEDAQRQANLILKESHVKVGA